MNRSKKCYLAIFLCGIIIIPIMLMEYSGIIQLNYCRGYGVDSDENVYIAQSDGQISVYRDNELLRRINAPTSRGYRMTVENDQILVGTGSYYYILDLDGTVLSKVEDPRSTVISSLQFNRLCTTSDDRQYKMSDFPGRTKIVDLTDGRIVYQMPMLSFVFRIVKDIAFVIFVCSGIVLVVSSVKQRRRKKKL